MRRQDMRRDLLVHSVNTAVRAGITSCITRHGVGVCHCRPQSYVKIHCDSCKEFTTHTFHAEQGVNGHFDKDELTKLIEDPAGDFVGWEQIFRCECGTKRRFGFTAKRIFPE